MNVIENERDEARYARDADLGMDLGEPEWDSERTPWVPRKGTVADFDAAKLATGEHPF